MNVPMNDLARWLREHAEHAYAERHVKAAYAMRAAADRIDQFSKPGVSEEMRILGIIAEGYKTDGIADQFVRVENPKYRPDNGEDPFIIFDTFAALEAASLPVGVGEPVAKPFRDECPGSLCARRDGITCADGECDLDSGIYTHPAAPIEQEAPTAGDPICTICASGEPGIPEICTCERQEAPSAVKGLTFALETLIKIRDAADRDRVNPTLNMVSAFGVDAAIIKLQAVLSRPAEVLATPTSSEVGEQRAEVERLTKEVKRWQDNWDGNIAEMSEKFRAVNIGRVIEATGQDIFALAARAEAAEAKLSSAEKALERAEPALSEMLALVKKHPDFQGREHVGLGILVHDAIDLARSTLGGPPASPEQGG